MIDLQRFLLDCTFKIVKTMSYWVQRDVIYSNNVEVKEFELKIDWNNSKIMIFNKSESSHPKNGDPEFRVVHESVWVGFRLKPNPMVSGFQNPI